MALHLGVNLLHQCLLMSLQNIRHGMVSLVHLWAELSTMTGKELRGGE